MQPESVCRRTITVNLREGLHLRPVSQIAQLAGRFPCQLFLSNGDDKVNAKSQLELMTLRADYGTALEIEGIGEDAPEAVDRLVALFESNFQDDSESQP